MNKIFLAFLILFSNGTKTDNKVTIEETFSSCSEKPITSDSLLVCLGSIAGSIALAATGGWIVGKAYGFAKQLAIYLKTKLFMKDFVKQLEEFAANKSLETKLQDIPGFEDTDLWRSFNIISQLDKSLKKYDIKTGFPTLGDWINLGTELKAKADTMVAAKAASASTIIENLNKLHILALDAKNELKWIFDRSQKISDAFIINGATEEGAAEIKRLKELFKSLKIQINPDPNVSEAMTTKFSIDIIELNTLVDDFFKKISPAAGSSNAIIKLDDIKDLFKNWNSKFKTTFKDNIDIIKILGPGPKAIKFDEKLSALFKLVNDAVKKQIPNLKKADRDGLVEEARKTVKQSNTTAYEYQEMMETIAKPDYQIMLKNKTRNSSYLEVMKKLVKKNIDNFKDGTETNLISLADNSIIEPEAQLEMLLTNNSRETSTKILKTEAFKKLFQDYVQKKLIKESFFDKKIKVDDDDSFTIYDLFKSQDDPTYKSFKALIKANDISLSKAKTIFKAKAQKALEAQEALEAELIKDEAAEIIQKAVKRKQALVKVAKALEAKKLEAQRVVVVGRAAQKAPAQKAPAPKAPAQRVDTQRAPAPRAPAPVPVKAAPRAAAL